MNFYYKEIPAKAPKMTLDEAKMYLLFLEHEGMTGWRFPTRDEILEVFRSNRDLINYVYEPREVWHTEDLTSPHIHACGKARVLAVKDKI